jgi:phage gpG-like protein
MTTRSGSDPSKQYGKYHQYGTSPYVIRPKNKRFLAFPVGDGSTIFTKRVNHPGLPARPFLGINEADIREINQIVSDHIFGQ